MDVDGHVDRGVPVLSHGASVPSTVVEIHASYIQLAQLRVSGLLLHPALDARNQRAEISRSVNIL